MIFTGKLIVSKDSELLTQIESKFRLVKIHAAIYEDQVLKQWVAEALYLGLTKKQPMNGYAYGNIPQQQSITKSESNLSKKGSIHHFNQF